MPPAIETFWSLLSLHCLAIGPAGLKLGHFTYIGVLHRHYHDAVLMPPSPATRPISGKIPAVGHNELGHDQHAREHLERERRRHAYPVDLSPPPL